MSLYATNVERLIRVIEVAVLLLIVMCMSVFFGYILFISWCLEKSKKESDKK